MLLEPATVVAKAWEQIVAVGQRALWEPRTVLVTGAGPIGLLAALLGKQRGLETSTCSTERTRDRSRSSCAISARLITRGPSPRSDSSRTSSSSAPGVGQVIADSLRSIGAGGIICLTGVGSGGISAGVAAADVAAEMVLRNNVVVGSVNANKRHWYKGAEALARADRSWLARLVTRRERPEDFEHALERQPDDIKVVIQFAEA